MTHLFPVAASTCCSKEAKSVHELVCNIVNDTHLLPVAVSICWGKEAISVHDLVGNIVSDTHLFPVAVSICWGKEAISVHDLVGNIVSDTHLFPVAVSTCWGKEAISVHDLVGNIVSDTHLLPMAVSHVVVLQHTGQLGLVGHGAVDSLRGPLLHVKEITKQNALTHQLVRTPPHLVIGTCNTYMLRVDGFAHFISPGICHMQHIHVEDWLICTLHLTWWLAHARHVEDWLTDLHTPPGSCFQGVVGWFVHSTLPGGCHMEHTLRTDRLICTRNLTWRLSHMQHFLALHFKLKVVCVPKRITWRRGCSFGIVSTAIPLSLRLENNVYTFSNAKKVLTVTYLSRGTEQQNKHAWQYMENGAKRKHE